MTTPVKQLSFIANGGIDVDVFLQLSLKLVYVTKEHLSINLEAFAIYHIFISYTVE